MPLGDVAKNLVDATIGGRRKLDARNLRNLVDWVARRFAERIGVREFPDPRDFDLRWRGIRLEQRQRLARMSLQNRRARGE